LLPQTSHAAGKFQGRDFGYGQAAIMCPGSEATFRTPASFGFTTVSIPLSRLRMAVESAPDCPLDPLTDSTRILPLGSAAVRQLIRFIRRALVCIQEESAAEPGSIIFQEIEQHIVSAMALALTADGEETPRKVIQRMQVFMQARDYIEANLAGPLGLEVLAQQTGVSLRTLRYSFQQVAGISPLQFIKVRRLTAARRLLLTAHPGETRVIDIALRCGFSHMSYFARDYRALFGQTPSQTLGSAV
jgi:AraC family ethanolamine operon transcriptional activator